MSSKAEALERVHEQVVECRRCRRLVQWRERVAIEKVRRFREEEYWGRPIPAFGSSEALLLIVGLAPAAHGANRTGRMFTGDRSGEWLCEALYRYGFSNQPTSVNRNDGLQLERCLLTAAIRCAPPQNKPLPAELLNCRRFLCEELRLLESKKVVLALGQIALNAVLNALLKNRVTVPKRSRIPFRHGGEWKLPGEVTLLISYHPSRQNTQTGRLTRSMFHAIFERAHRLIEEPPRD